MSDLPESVREGEGAKRDEGDLAAENARLREQSKARRDFLQNLAHELATPLTPLVGYLKLLKSGRLGPLTDKQAHVLDSMVHATERLEKSLDNLVDYTALETGQYRIHRHEFDVAALAESIVQEAQAAARGKHVRIDFKKHDGIVIPGDEPKIRQALANVLENALRFSPHGGHVLVWVVADQGKATVSVFDQGPGITPEQLRDLLVVGHDHRPGGAGLGLPVAKQVAEAHGGSLLVESPPKEQPGVRELFSGTRVTLSLPLPPGTR